MHAYVLRFSLHLKQTSDKGLHDADDSFYVKLLTFWCRTSFRNSSLKDETRT